MAAKIVYYGPGLCGKTTNLQYIYQKTAPKSRGEMVSLETETDRTLFFDLLPIDVGNIAGFKTRFQLYTVPGQVFYNSTRKLVLRGVDGLVYVADSQVPMLEANIESLNNLRENLSELGIELDDIPMVFQYNKRDLGNISSVDELNRVLNQRKAPFFEAAAVNGSGVFETLKGISKETLVNLHRKAIGEDRPKITDTRRPAAAASAAAAPAEKPQVAVSAHVVAAPPETVLPKDVEFSLLATPAPKPTMKKISVEAAQIASKLDALRDLYTGKQSSNDKKGRDSTLDAFAEILESAKNKEQTLNKKLKIKLDPAELEDMKNLAVDFRLTGSSMEKRFSNAASMKIEGTGNPRKLVLKIELEISKK
jgi:small GTP-binding protein